MRRAILFIMVLALMTGINQLIAEAVVFTDTFTGSNSVYATNGVIGTTGLTAIRSGDDWGSRLFNNRLEMHNDISITANLSGWVFGYNTNALASPYNTTLSSNSGYVTWTFNMRSPRNDPDGFALGEYGIAYILAGSSNSPQSNGTGYAVVLGQSGTTDPIRLVKYSGGLSGTLTNLIISNTSGLTDFATENLSLAVKYLPTSNTWELYVRNDGISNFVDPRTGTLTSQGTAVDNGYTGTSLPYAGTYWQGSTTAQTAYFDNIKITVTAEPTAQPTALAFNNVHSITMDVAYTASSGADGYLAIRRTGAAPTGIPTDGITYTAGTVLGDATVVYSGSATGFSQTGLSPSTAYYYKVFAYAGAGITINYLTTEPLSGNKSTTSVLIMHLDANTLGLTNGAKVSNWTDQSGNNKNAVQDTLANQPTYSTNVINGKPAVVFNGTSNYLAFDGNIAVNTNYTIFAVVRRAAGDNNIRAIMGGTNPSLNKNMHLGWRSNGIFTHAQYSNDYDMKVPTYIASEAPIIVAFRHSSTLGNDTYINGGLRGLNMNTATTGRLAHLGEWTGAALGRYIGGVSLNTRFNGWIAEVKVYDAYLSDTERKAVESVLASKYNLTVANTVSPFHYTDMIELNVSAAGTVSQETGGLTLKGTYLTAFARIRAGNNAATGLSVSFNPSVVSYPRFLRLNREWFANIFGTLNTSFSFDLDALGLVPFAPAGGAYKLLFRNDSKDNYSIVAAPAVVEGRIITFTINPLSTVTNNGFYTLGTLDSEVSTLPVELSSFTVAISAMGMVQLMWVTQSETNVLGYNVFRSIDAELGNAEQLNVFIPATNTSQEQVYQFTDTDLYEPGTYYYWLQALDLDGSMAYHGPVSIDFNNGTNPAIPDIPVITQLKSVYPNPFNPSTTISYGIATPSEVSLVIYNTRGQLVRTFNEGKKVVGNYTLQWNGCDNNSKECSTGVYFIRMSAGQNSFIRKAVLMK